MTHETTLDKLFAGLPLFRLYLADQSGGVNNGLWLGTPMLPTKLANIAVHRGRDNALSQPAAGTLALTVAGELANSAGDPLDVMTGVQLRLNAAAIAVLRPGLSFALPRFTGRVTDLGEVAVDPRASSTRVPIIAASLIGKLSSATYNLGVFAAESSDLDVLQNVFIAFWITDAGVRLGDWRADPNIWIAPMIATGPLPAGHRFGSIDASGGDLAGVLSTVLGSTLGVVFERADGTIDYARPNSRPGPSAYIDLPTSCLLSPASMGKRVGDVVNYQEAGYVHDDGTFWGTARSPALDPDGTAPLDASLDVYGYYPGAGLSTMLNHRADAQALADFVTGRFGLPAWRITSVTVDVLALLQDPAVADVVVEDFLNLDLEDLVRFTGSWPAHTPRIPGKAWVISIDERVTATSWTVTLGVVDYSLLGNDLTWAQVDPAVTWASLPAGLDWQRMAAFQP